MTELWPIIQSLVPRLDREQRLKQRARVLWLYGLSGAGKSTLASLLEARLASEGHTTALLDGDIIRDGLNRDLGFSDADRAENLRRVAEVAKLLTQFGVISLCAFITPLSANRRVIRNIIGTEDLVEVYLSASFATCAKRDPKGLYARAAVGGLSKFTGRDSGFEVPATDESPLLIDSEHETVDESLAYLYAQVSPRLRLSA